MDAAHAGTRGWVHIMPAQLRHTVVAKSERLWLGVDGREYRPVFSYKIQNSNFFFRHMHGDLNLNEIKNALRLLSVNRETNLMNLIRL